MTDVEFNPEAKDGDGDGMVQDGTEFERPIEDVAVDPTAEASADDVITAPEPVESAPAITSVSDGVIGTGSVKKDKAPAKKAAPAAKEGDMVAIFAERNVVWQGLGKVSSGYNFVSKEDAEKWLTLKTMRKATPEEIKANLG